MMNMTHRYQKRSRLRLLLLRKMPKWSERTAANGFAALSELDSNADQVFDANDTAYADLKIWRDLNQDAISQAGELQSLSDAGITAINLKDNTQGIQYQKVGDASTPGRTPDGTGKADTLVGGTVIHYKTNSCSRLSPRHRRPKWSMKHGCKAYPLEASQRRYRAATEITMHSIAECPYKSMARGKFGTKRPGRSTRPAHPTQEVNP